MIYMECIMKKLLFLLAACLLFLSSCAEGGDYLSYQRGIIYTSVDFFIEGTTYTADIFLTEGAEDGTRDAAILFTAPENMSGITVKRVGEASYLSMDGIEIPMLPAALSGFFDIADAFSIDGTLDRIETGEGTNILYISSPSGAYTVTLDTKTSLPQRIIADVGGRVIDIDVKSFIKK